MNLAMLIKMQEAPTQLKFTNYLAAANLKLIQNSSTFSCKHVWKMETRKTSEALKNLTKVAYSLSLERSPAALNLSTDHGSCPKERKKIYCHANFTCNDLSDLSEGKPMFLNKYEVQSVSNSVKT
jgi:hypothetical protein